MKRATIFSADRAHRYTLWREWIGGTGYVQFIGLNPSTADEVQNDPTVRRCIAFAKAWGYSAMCMTNLFAYRATNPDVMKRHADPVGSLNNWALLHVAGQAALIVAAWGVHGTHQQRGWRVRRLLEADHHLHCLGRTKDGEPKHPLYLRADTRPVPL